MGGTVQDNGEILFDDEEEVWVKSAVPWQPETVSAPPQEKMVPPSGVPADSRSAQEKHVGRKTRLIFCALCLVSGPCACVICAFPQDERLVWIAPNSLKYNKHGARLYQKGDPDREKDNCDSCCCPCAC